MQLGIYTPVHTIWKWRPPFKHPKIELQTRPPHITAGRLVQTVITSAKTLPLIHVFTLKMYLFFSSSSLLAFFLNLGSSCCSSSLAASRSLSAVLSLAKWNVVLSPVWRTSWSWTLAFPSGLIFWPVQSRNSSLSNFCRDDHFCASICSLTASSTHSGYLHTSGWLWSDLCLLDPRLYVQPSDRECHPASSGGPFSPPTEPPLIAMSWLKQLTEKTDKLLLIIVVTTH